jgi:hypothetical protein
VVKKSSSPVLVSGTTTRKGLARSLADIAIQLRGIVLEEIRKTGDSVSFRLRVLLREGQASLSDEAFADSYAQTLVYGLFVSRWLCKDSFETSHALSNLPVMWDRFSEMLEVLNDLPFRGDTLLGLFASLDPHAFFDEAEDPVLHFYQEFLEAYDPGQRRSRGVYYTPDEVVTFMVARVHDALRDRFGLRLGLADATTWREYAEAQGRAIPHGTDPDAPVVQILDPATGTGTYLLEVLRVIHATMQKEWSGHDDAQNLWQDYVAGKGSWKGRGLLDRLHGFEIMPAPFYVCHLRLGLALQETGFRFEEEARFKVFLTNTLDLVTTSFLSSFMAPGLELESESIKREAPISVILGNPPYDRLVRGSTPLWVVDGQVPGRKDGQSLFDDILDVAREHTIFSHHANLYNLYVYFWRWALWKVFERDGDAPGIVSFITPSSWLTGPGFLGLRKLAREHGDTIWTVDLGGDNKGTKPDPNVFAIQTPVAITTLCRASPVRDKSLGVAAKALYRKIRGESAEAKLRALLDLVEEGIGNLEDWEVAGSNPFDPLVPSGGDAFWLDMPLLRDIFPWQQPGCKVGRLWPIAPTPALLKQRWEVFTHSDVEERESLFDTKATGRNLHTPVGSLPPLSSLSPGDPEPPIRRYGYRSFDRQWIFEDPRLAKTERPSLWASLSDKQIFLCSLRTSQMSEGSALTVATSVPDLYFFKGSFGGKDILPLYREASPQFFLTSQMTNDLGSGPAMTVSAHVPDLHHFCGRGGKDILPMYREPNGLKPNITHGLLSLIGNRLGIPDPVPEDLAAYVYALLSSFRYQERFAKALETPGPRVPVTEDPNAWQEAVLMGRYLLWLHTYAERFVDVEQGRGPKVPSLEEIQWIDPVTKIPENPGQIRYDIATQTLKVGDGQISGVRPDVWSFSVSGMPVVKKWLGYRTRKGAGRAASSPNALDQIRPTEWAEEWNQELIDLLTVLTLTMDMQSSLADLLDRICAGPLISATELPVPTKSERSVPKVHSKGSPKKP